MRSMMLEHHKGRLRRHLPEDSAWEFTAKTETRFGVLHLLADFLQAWLIEDHGKCVATWRIFDVDPGHITRLAMATAANPDRFWCVDLTSDQLDDDSVRPCDALYVSTRTADLLEDAGPGEPCLQIDGPDPETLGVVDPGPEIFRLIYLSLEKFVTG